MNPIELKQRSDKELWAALTETQNTMDLNSNDRELGIYMVQHLADRLAQGDSHANDCEIPVMIHTAANFLRIASHIVDTMARYEAMIEAEIDRRGTDLQNSAEARG